MSRNQTACIKVAIGLLAAGGNSDRPDTVALLKAQGHILQERENVIVGDGETVAIDPATGLRLGASDFRKPDSHTAGY